MALGWALRTCQICLFLLLFTALNLVGVVARDGHNAPREQALLLDLGIQRPLEAAHVFVSRVSALE